MEMKGLIYLKSVIGSHAHTEALRDGRMPSPRVSLAFETVEGALRNAMTRMARQAEFDLCEMSPTSYLMARLSGAPLIALPVFPYRQFPLDQIVVRADAGVRGPGDLAGKRIGTRTWAQPTGLWIREVSAAAAMGVLFEVDAPGSTPSGCGRRTWRSPSTCRSVTPRGRRLPPTPTPPWPPARLSPPPASARA